MFDLKSLPDDELLRLNEELRKTRGSPLEQIAMIFAESFKITLRQEQERRRIAKAAPEPKK